MVPKNLENSIPNIMILSAPNNFRAKKCASLWILHIYIYMYIYSIVSANWRLRLKGFTILK